MELKEMTIEELMEKRAAIIADVEGVDEADTEARSRLESLEADAKAVNEELEARKVAAAKKEEARKAVAAGAGEVLKEKIVEEKKKMNMKELRASEAYIDAFAEYIKSNGKNDTEIRQLISANAPEAVEGNKVPVPTYLEERIQTAWEKDDILSRVRKTFLRGNLESSFELSATEAEIHPEGGDEPAEEELVFGNITIVPEMIKKWITITDTVAKLKGREFLDYLYDEITYRIILKAQAVGISDILNAPATSDETQIGVPSVTGAPSVTIIPTAAANLSAEATQPVVIMNRLTEVEFLNAQVLGNFAVDPYAGLPRVYTNALKSYSAASANETYAIVGDLNGLQFNFPDGEDVEIIY